MGHFSGIIDIYRKTLSSTFCSSEILTYPSDILGHNFMKFGCSRHCGATSNCIKYTYVCADIIEGNV